MVWHATGVSKRRNEQIDVPLDLIVRLFAQRQTVPVFQWIDKAGELAIGREGHDRQPVLAQCKESGCSGRIADGGNALKLRITVDPNLKEKPP